MAQTEGVGTGVTALTSFAAGAAIGTLLLPECGQCGRLHWYPREICPLCGSAEVRWLEAAGTGEIYSFSIMRRANEPYAVAFVRLAEGLTMLTNLVDCDFGALAVGLPVRLIFRSAGGNQVPCFTAVNETEQQR